MSMLYLPSKSATSARGFTMVELLVAIAVVGLVLAAVIPQTSRFYESMQYRQAVRTVLATLGSARLQAVHSGKAQDVTLDPAARVLGFQGKTRHLPDRISIRMRTAVEVNRGSVGVIRFYPEGGASGGDIDIQSPSGPGVTITVDWLMGGVTQESYGS